MKPFTWTNSSPAVVLADFDARGIVPADYLLDSVRELHEFKDVLLKEIADTGLELKVMIGLKMMVVVGKNGNKYVFKVE